MENGIQLKNPGAQKILEKFSQHYGILKIFQERVHEKFTKNFKKSKIWTWVAGGPVLIHLIRMLKSW